jgi:ankyrin repeat protein
MDQVTEFCEALWKGDTRNIARLIARIDPNAEDRWRRTPLAMAAQYADERLVRQLLERGADVDGGRSLLTPTDGPKAARVATLLIERGAAVDARNRDGVTPCARSEIGDGRRRGSRGVGSVMKST